MILRDFATLISKKRNELMGLATIMIALWGRRMIIP